MKERSATKETVKSALMDKSAQSVPSNTGQREGKQIVQASSQPKRSKKQIREDEASYANIARIQCEEASIIASLKRHKRV